MHRLSVLLALLAAHVRAEEPPNYFGNDAGVPQLSFLALRSGDRPIELNPDFAPSHFVYKASLDFLLSSFAVDAGGAGDAEIVNLLDIQTSRGILPGDTREISITVRDVNTKAKMTYTLQVTRLNGQDTKISDCQVTGATLSPMFDPAITQYYVRLPAEQDHVRVRFVPWDTGQSFQVTAANVAISPPAAVRQPAAAARRALANGEEGALTRSRRLMPSNLAGEVQRSVIERVFAIEVGGSRLINITVRPANGAADAKPGNYILKCMRANCPNYQPFYAPDMKACAMTCNEGYFPLSSVSRCEACTPHCLKCSGWGKCQICEPSQWRVLYFVRLVNGYCQVVPVPWQSIVAVIVAIVVCCAFCCCLGGCDCCRGGRNGSRKKVGANYRPNAYSEEDEQQSHRLLPKSGDGRYQDFYDE